MFAAAKLVPRANADAEGVADRIELHTRDTTDLEVPGDSVDLVVSSLAIHNLPGNQTRRAAIVEAVRRAWWGLPLIRTHAVTAAKPLLMQ